jgi:hypothetical protein
MEAENINNAPGDNRINQSWLDTCVTGIVYIFSLHETTELIRVWVDTCVIDIVYIFSLQETLD